MSRFIISTHEIRLSELGMVALAIPTLRRLRFQEDHDLKAT
jgi:hypothetical protein